MTTEEENQHLREQLAQRDAKIEQQDSLLLQQSLLIEQMQAQIAGLSQQAKDFHDRLAKNSHNSSLPPSSDRFGRQPKSLRKKSEKKSGGQEGHEGMTLPFSQAPDEVIEHRVAVCASCQHDLREVEACVTLRRQVVDIPSPRLIVQEHRAEQKQCPRCQHLTQASFPPSVTAPIQYGPLIAAVAVYLTQQQLLPLQRSCEVLSDWAADLKSLLLDMKEATEQARAQGKRGLDAQEVMDWERAFLRLLDEGDAVTPRATAPPGTRGRIKQSAARNLLDRVRKQQKAVFCFLEDLRVDFDNNLAERDLRMIKVQQKVSGCFRSLAGAQAFSRIRGYLSTLRKQGLPLLSALQATLCGHPLLPSL
jgi:transposase